MITLLQNCKSESFPYLNFVFLILYRYKFITFVSSLFISLSSRL
jgi:hypothetical protein